MDPSCSLGIARVCSGSAKATSLLPLLGHIINTLMSKLVRFRRGSTLVSTVLRKSVRFFRINTFLIIKNTFQVETWAICYLSDSKTQERGLKELNTKTFLGKPAPQTPLDSACAFGPRLGNRSVFIPDPRLRLTLSVIGLVPFLRFYWSRLSLGP